MQPTLEKYVSLCIYEPTNNDGKYPQQSHEGLRRLWRGCKIISNVLSGEGVTGCLYILSHFQRQHLRFPDFLFLFCKVEDRVSVSITRAYNGLAGEQKG